MQTSDNFKQFLIYFRFAIFGFLIVILLFGTFYIGEIAICKRSEGVTTKNLWKPLCLIPKETDVCRLDTGQYVALNKVQLNVS